MQPLMTKFWPAFAPVLRPAADTRGPLPTHMLFSPDFAPEELPRPRRKPLVLTRELACAQ